MNWWEVLIVAGGTMLVLGLSDLISAAADRLRGEHQRDDEDD